MNRQTLDRIVCCITYPHVLFVLTRIVARFDSIGSLFVDIASVSPENGWTL